MSDKTFENILTYIQNNISYFSKPIFFVLHKFFEPLIYPELLYRRTKRIKELFPDSIIKINSNCDFLNADNIYSLQYIDRLSVPDYANHKNLLKLCSIEGIDKNDKTLYLSHINNTKVTIHNHKINLLSRGSVLHYKENNYNFKNRADDCDIYGKFFSIASDGSVMPCYDTLPYIDIHKEVILGNINDKNFIFPKKLYIANKECCRYCNANIIQCI